MTRQPHTHTHTQADRQRACEQMSTTIAIGSAQQTLACKITRIRSIPRLNPTEGISCLPKMPTNPSYRPPPAIDPTSEHKPQASEPISKRTAHGRMRLNVVSQTFANQNYLTNDARIVVQTARKTQVKRKIVQYAVGIQVRKEKLHLVHGNVGRCIVAAKI
jgi:translation elongation factor EF-Ts